MEKLDQFNNLPLKVNFFTIIQLSSMSLSSKGLFFFNFFKSKLIFYSHGLTEMTEKMATIITRILAHGMVDNLQSLLQNMQALL